MTRLLLVEDDVSNRLTLSVLLEELGFEVTEAPTYEDAERFLRAQPFDAVVLDRGLGGRDGIELAPIARASRNTTRVVVLSGSDAMTSSSPHVDAWVMKGGGVLGLLDALRPPKQ